MKTKPVPTTALVLGILAILAVAMLSAFSQPSIVHATAGPSDVYAVDPGPRWTPAQNPNWLTVKTVYISATTNGNNAVVAAVTGKSIVVWAFEVSAAVATNVYWESATTQISETVYLAATGGWTADPLSLYGSGATPRFHTVAGEALQLNCSTTGPTGVWVKYTEE